MEMDFMRIKFFGKNIVLTTYIMPIIKCELCEQPFKSKVSLKKHKCLKKELTNEEKLESIYQMMKLYDLEFNLSLELLRQDKDLFFERLCKLLEKPKIEELIVNEPIDIDDEVEEFC